MLCKMISQKEVPIRHACSSLNISKSAYYNYAKPNAVNNYNTTIKKIIHEIALEYTKYGYRRVTKELHRRGKRINHKKVLKIMREENILCKPKKKFKIVTTDSNHNYPIYSNLTESIVLTRINQLWVADITYVHLLNECVYLAVIIDVYSRKCIGWELSRRINALLVQNALDRAIDARLQFGIDGLIHHSDQGVQYACNEYVDLLEKLNIKISMSRRGNPYDNAFAESFIKTLKAEEIYLKEYKTFDEAYRNLKNFIEKVYNKKRLHSSIGYLPPDEFEAKTLNISLS